MKQFNLEEYLANPSRKVVTRDGKNVRIVCTDVKGELYPVLALVDNWNGEIPTRYTKDGKFISNDEYPCDLFFVTEKHEGWVNIFKGVNSDYYVGDSRIFESKEDAEKAGEQSCKVEDAFRKAMEE